METKLIKKNEISQNNSIEISQSDIDTLVKSGIIPKDIPLDQVKLFARVCAEKNLSPFSRQIYLIPRKIKDQIKYNIQTSIDGYRSMAERTGVYAGNDDYIFNEGIKEYQCIQEGKNKPTTATSIVYKIVQGIRCSFSATARWEEYWPGAGLDFMWNKMPFLMLGKCAESLALRKAFPEALKGIYTNEEMQQADNIKHNIETSKGNNKEIKEISNNGTVKISHPFSEKILNKYISIINNYKTSIEIKLNSENLLKNAIIDGLQNKHQLLFKEYCKTREIELKEKNLKQNVFLIFDIEEKINKCETKDDLVKEWKQLDIESKKNESIINLFKIKSEIFK